MALQIYTLALGNLKDDQAGNNYSADTPVYILKSDGLFANIYRDSSGSSLIIQNGIDNISNASGEFTFYVESGQYIARVNGKENLINVIGSTYFDSRVEDSVSQIIEETQKSRGFRVVGDFASGFTYELANDVATDGSGNYWVYADINALPVTVSAGTTPSEPTYTQVTFNQASGVTTTAGINAQQFIDNFELKIFQSPTDNLTNISTFAGGVGVVYEVRKTSDNSLATIYSDKGGVTAIPQNGVANVSNSDAECVFYIASGDYTINIGALESAVNVRGISSFETLQDAVSSKSLTEGDVITTGGYNSLGDGGHATYAVVASGTGAPDFGSILDTGNGNQLKLLVQGGRYSTEVFGVFPDGATNWESAELARFEAMQNFGINNKLTLVWRAGYYATSINMSPAKSGMKLHFEHGAELGGILHVIGTSAASPLTDVSITGEAVTYDRLGIQFTERCYIERVHCKSDQAKNVASGTISRGCHISESNIDLEMGYLEIDDCTNGNNSDAALAIDGTPSSSNVTIDYVWIKDSQTNGTYIMGDNINIGLLRVDAFCSLAPTRLPIGANAGQDARGNGVWFNRCWDSHIDEIVVDQNFNGFTRGNTAYHVLFDETGITSSPETNKRPLTVGTITVRNAASQGGVSFGDPISLSSNLNVEVGIIDVEMSPGKKFASPLTEAAVRVDNIPGKIKVGSIRFFETNDNAALFTRAGSKLTLGSLETDSKGDTNANAVKIEGYIDGSPTFDIDISGTSGTLAAFSLRGGASEGSKIGLIYVRASSAVNTPAVLIENTQQLEIEKIRTVNARNNVANVDLNLIQRSRIGGLSLEGSGAAGIGLRCQTIVESSLENGRVTDFSLGITGSGFTRTNAINLHSLGNTTATDITAGSIVELNCTSIQL